MITHINDHPEDAEQIDYREADTFEDRCRNCRFSAFVEDGVYCELHDLIVDGKCCCKDHE